MNDYTYQGVTVSYSDAQKSIILADQQSIKNLQDQVNQLQGAIGAINDNISAYSSAVSNNPHGSCYTQNYFGGWVVDQKCVDDNNAAWQAEINHRSSVQSQIDTINNSEIPVSVKKLNDDLATIQNDIKLQIQTQIANTAANTAGATAANIPNQSALINQQQLAALANQATADKLKQEQNIQVIKFILVAIVILGVTFLVAKRI